MTAILSDVHGNLEALTEVLADASRHGVTAIYNLGDLVGYGPNPVECVEIAMSWDINLQGNIDHSTANPPDGFPPSLERNLDWTRRQLRNATANDPLRWLDSLPAAGKCSDAQLVHGSPHNPLHEYVFPEDLYNPRKMARIAAALDRHCFSGHSHVAGVFLMSEEPGWEYHDPHEVGLTWQLDGRKTIINVGSVGQPRDGDWRASYVLLNGLDVTFRRVEYDVGRTVRKIHEIAEIEDIQGDRLREGR